MFNNSDDWYFNIFAHFCRIWFENVLVSEDPVFIGQLLPVILERSGLLFSIPELIEDVHK